MKQETNLNPFIDFYLRCVFLFILASVDLLRHTTRPESTLTVFELEQKVRWPYAVKVSLMALCFGLTTLSVSNTGCITLTAVPFMLPPILTVTEEIPRIIWLLLIVLSFVGTGFASIGQDYTPLNGDLGLEIRNYRAFKQSIAAMICYTLSRQIGYRNETLQNYAMHPTVDTVYFSLLITLFAPCFLFGYLSLNGGDLGITWLVTLYGLLQGALFWVIYT